jgi:hypothetical protein
MRAFLGRCADVCEDDGTASMFGDQPQLWKTVGDEVLFTKVLTHHDQVALVLDCWLHAIDKMRAYLQKDGSNLDIKGTAWLAGFPFRNSEVAVSKDENIVRDEDGDWFVEGGKLLNRVYAKEAIPVAIDYIGPSIDIGFRLTTLSSTRQLTISVDVAYILSLSNPGPLENSPVFNIYYGGSATLRGVFGGVRYPIFWIDMSPENSLDRMEDELVAREPLSRDVLRRYCRRFYDTNEAYTFPPFISSTLEQTLTKRPDWYDEDLRALVANATLQPLTEEPDCPAATDVEKEKGENEQVQRRMGELKDRWSRVVLLLNDEERAVADAFRRQVEIPLPMKGASRKKPKVPAGKKPSPKGKAK